ncbi:MAG: Cysteine-rich secretory protein family [Thermoleophilaceae bacterium]|nr:Cysteine-rich secretory protein family [Thermoleophilaceae bacterium]MEA2368425.1 Cysteine-rich secretory protein family [Thermoleophilaceae bacterium]
MARMRSLMAIVVATCAFAALTAVPASASPESYMLRKVNHYRRAHGVRAVHLSHSLKRSARKYAHYMMRHQYFGHARRIHASHKYRRLGEILEWQTGYKPGVARAFRCWLGSSSHRAIILDGSFTYAGAGRAKGHFRGRKSTLWVMHFGRK